MRGYEKIWIIGDDFAYNTYQDHFKNLKSEDGTPTTYTYLNFEVRAYLTSQHSMNCKNILSRFRNSLITALNEHAVLPKLIAIIPDDDIINQVVDDEKVQLDLHYERLLSGLCNMLTKTVSCYKDMIPLKAKRENIPHFLWVAPPTHKYFSNDNNMRRDLFGKALNVACNAQKGMSLLRMIKFWDHDDANLFLSEQYRYTANGLSIYWRSVDAAIRFWNVALSKKLDKVKPKKSVDQDKSATKTNSSHYEWKGKDFARGGGCGRPRGNRFKWYNNNYSNQRRRLSTPP